MTVKNENSVAQLEKVHEFTENAESSGWLQNALTPNFSLDDFIL